MAKINCSGFQSRARPFEIINRLWLASGRAGFVAEEALSRRSSVIGSEPLKEESVLDRAVKRESVIKSAVHFQT